MGDEESQVGANRSISAAQFASKRGGRHEQTLGSRRRRRPSRRRFLLENQEQGQYLDGFAQSHIVRETGAKPEAVSR